MGFNCMCEHRVAQGLQRVPLGSHWGYIGVTKGRTYSIVTLWFGVWVYAEKWCEVGVVKGYAKISKG